MASNAGSEVESSKLADVLSNKLSYDGYINDNAITDVTDVSEQLDTSISDVVPDDGAAEEDSILRQELFEEDGGFEDQGKSDQVPDTPVGTDENVLNLETGEVDDGDWDENEEEAESGDSGSEVEDDEEEADDDDDDIEEESEDSEILDEECLDKLESELGQAEEEAKNIISDIEPQTEEAGGSTENAPSTSTKTTSTTTGKKRKRKKEKKEKSKKKLKNKIMNKRRNIRQIIDESELDKDTLAAQNEEFERKKRLNELKKNLASNSKPVIKEEKDSELKSLLQAAEDEAEQAIESSKNKDVMVLDKKAEIEEDKEVITLSSDDDEDEDGVMMMKTAEDEIEEEDMNNAGSHINDDINCPDEQGRVLINLSHPAQDPDIFLAPQIARAIKPHQIGGIRFLYDNVVECLERHESTPGFGCILAHSMGLGKTLQMIGFIEIYIRFTKAKSALCIVPINTLQNWMGEFNMWAPDPSQVPPNVTDVLPRGFRVFLMNDNYKTTAARARVIAEWKSAGGVLLMGYEMYRLLSSRKTFAAKPKKSKKISTEPEVIDVDEEDKNKSLMIDIFGALVNPGPDIIICDEGHRIKNSHAGISQSLKNIKTRRRVVLTGYPLQNNLQEYWCMVDFVRPNFLGTKTEFSNMFERPMTNGFCIDSTEKDLRLMRHRAYVLHSLLEGFVQRRGHAVLNISLPEKLEYVFMIRMSPIQRALYNRFMSTISDTALGSWANNNPLKSFSVCCKIWNHPDVLHKIVTQRKSDEDDLDLEGNEATKKRSKVKDTTDGMITYEWADELMKDYQTGILEHSGKMVFLNSIIEESLAVGDKLLVFSQSLFTLNLIEEYLSQRNVPRPNLNEKWCKNRSYFRLDGSTSAQDREKLIMQFNQPNNDVSWLFLLSTRAGCLGINLVGANRVIVFDASWNPCHDCQAVCRVFRFGQKKNSYIYRLVTDNTLERKIYDRQVSKQKMSDRVVDDLNPDNMKRSTNDLLQYVDRDFPEVDIGDQFDDCEDHVIVNVLRKQSKWITEMPFTHESLLLDRRELRLSKREKQLAKEGYARDKKLSVSYSRPSYAAFYPNRGLPILRNQQGMIVNRGNFMRPVASVKPMISTPVPMTLKSGIKAAPLGNSIMRPGVSVHQVITTTEIVLPGSNTATQAGTVNRIPPGQKVLVIKTLKGVYIRTADKKLFAVRSKGLPGPSMAPPGPLNLSTSSISNVQTTTTSGFTGPIPSISSSSQPSSLPPNFNIKVVSSCGKEKKLVINRAPNRTAPNSATVKAIPKIFATSTSKRPVNSDLLQNELLATIYNQTSTVNAILKDQDSNSTQTKSGVPGDKQGETTVTTSQTTSKSSISSAIDNLMNPVSTNPFDSILGDNSNTDIGKDLSSNFVSTIGNRMKPVGISKPATATGTTNTEDEDEIIPALVDQPINQSLQDNNQNTVTNRPNINPSNLPTPAVGPDNRSHPPPAPHLAPNLGSSNNFINPNSQNNVAVNPFNTPQTSFTYPFPKPTDNAPTAPDKSFYNPPFSFGGNKEESDLESTSDLLNLCNQYSESGSLDFTDLGSLTGSSNNNSNNSLDQLTSNEFRNNPDNSVRASGAEIPNSSAMNTSSNNMAPSFNNMDNSTNQQAYTNSFSGGNYNPMTGFGNFNTGNYNSSGMPQANSVMDQNYSNPYNSMPSHPFFPYFPQHNYPMMGQAPGMGMHMGGMPMMGGFNPGMMGGMQPSMMSPMPNASTSANTNNQLPVPNTDISNSQPNSQVPMPQGMYGMPYMNTPMNPFMYNNTPNNMYMPMMNPFSSMAAQQMGNMSHGMNQNANQSMDQTDTTNQSNTGN